MIGCLLSGKETASPKTVRHPGPGETTPKTLG
jgi:hypothetical protein